MGMLRCTQPAAKPLIELSEMDPEVQAIGSNWEAEIKFPNHLKPPDLLKISYRLKSARQDPTYFSQSMHIMFQSKEKN
jgi:hypothetical protein